jgi:hypothetical protein
MGRLLMRSNGNKIFIKYGSVNKETNCKIKNCDYYDVNMELNCSFGDDNSKCINMYVCNNKPKSSKATIDLFIYIFILFLFALWYITTAVVVYNSQAVMDLYYNRYNIDPPDFHDKTLNIPPIF